MSDLMPLVDLPSRSALRGAPTLTVVVPCYNERPNVAPLIARLDAALCGIAWEVIYVDDNSPDGTTAEVRRIAQTDSRVRCIRRIGRRGLASAVIEGAPVVLGTVRRRDRRRPAARREPAARHAVGAAQTGDYDLAVASRHVEGGDDAGLSGRWRHLLSDGGIRLAQAFLPMRLTDPMSGFFMLPRPLFEQLAGNLTGQGFKILLDLALSSPAPLRVHRTPVRVPRAGRRREQARRAGAGAVRRPAARQGVRRPAAAAVHLLRAGRRARRAGASHGADRGTESSSAWQFEAAQASATVVAMVFNFELNNGITYRDQRLRGPRLWRGLLLFMVVCGVGAVANIGIAKSLYEHAHQLDDRGRDRRDDRRGLELRGLGHAGLARAITPRPAQPVIATSAAASPAPAYGTPACWALAALAALTLLRLVVAAIAPLAPDEAYYWVWSRALAARLPGPSADGGALDPRSAPRWPATDRWASGCSGRFRSPLLLYCSPMRPSTCCRIARLACMPR